MDDIHSSIYLGLLGGMMYLGIDGLLSTYYQYQMIKNRPTRVRIFGPFTLAQSFVEELKSLRSRLEIYEHENGKRTTFVEIEYK